MNILLFPRILSKTGVGNYVKSLGEELVNKGHSVIIVSSKNELDIDKKVRFEFLPVGSRNPVCLLKNIKALHDIIKDNDIQIVHCHHRYTALIMKIYNMFYKIPFVYTLHLANIPSDIIHRSLTFVGERAIAISSEVKRSLINDLGIQPERITSIPNGVKIINQLSDEQIKKQKAIWNIPLDKYILTLHSRIDHTKNHLLMVDAVAKLPNNVKERILVVCSGEMEGEYYRKVINRIAELGLTDSFKFVGWCDATSILGISNFLFLPSFNEGFPLSVIEAFMMKVPVARTKTAGFDEQRYCIPIDPYDPQPIIDIIEDLVENGDKKYKERVELAYTLAMEEFTLEIMTERNVNVYKEVCSK